MNTTLSLAHLVSQLAGVLILIVPRLLNYIVAAYLIVAGLLGGRSPHEVLFGVEMRYTKPPLAVALRT